MTHSLLFTTTTLKNLANSSHDKSVVPSGSSSNTFVPDYVQVNRCVICSGPTETTIELPKLPFTESYCKEPVPSVPAPVDQKLLFCTRCGHGQLETQIQATTLYGSNYLFRTSASSTARKGTSFFLSALDEIAPKKKFKCVLDLGCNDLFLLSQLKDRASLRIGIDPVWRDKESEREDLSICLYGSSVEDISLSDLPEKADLVVCRHTLEHIADPAQVLEALLEHSAPDALFLFETPAFDTLIDRFRFDQVFHQHFQYFSPFSFSRLLEKFHIKPLLIHRNIHDSANI